MMTTSPPSLPVLKMLNASSSVDGMSHNDGSGYLKDSNPEMNIRNDYPLSINPALMGFFAEDGSSGATNEIFNQDLLRKYMDLERVTETSDLLNGDLQSHAAIIANLSSPVTDLNEPSTSKGIIRKPRKETLEQKAKTRERKRKWWAFKIRNETPDERTQRLEIRRKQEEYRQSKKSLEEKVRRIEKRRLQRALRQINLPTEKKEQSLEARRRRFLEKVQSETPEEREQRLEASRTRWKKKVENETPEKKAERAKRVEEKLKNETPEEKERRLEKGRKRWENKVKRETPEERLRRMEKERDRLKKYYWRKKMEQLTLEQTAEWLEAQRKKLLEAKLKSERREIFERMIGEKPVEEQVKKTQRGRMKRNVERVDTGSEQPEIKIPERKYKTGKKEEGTVLRERPPRKASLKAREMLKSLGKCNETRDEKLETHLELNDEGKKKVRRQVTKKQKETEGRNLLGNLQSEIPSKEVNDRPSENRVDFLNVPIKIERVEDEESQEWNGEFQDDLGFVENFKVEVEDEICHNTESTYLEHVSTHSEVTIKNEDPISINHSFVEVFVDCGSSGVTNRQHIGPYIMPRQGVAENAEHCSGNLMDDFDRIGKRSDEGEKLRKNRKLGREQTKSETRPESPGGKKRRRGPELATGHVRARREKVIQSDETEDKWKRKVERLRMYSNKKLKQETPEERERRLERSRAYMREKLKNETPEERARRLQKLRQYARQRLKIETPEEKAVRLKTQRTEASTPETYEQCKRNKLESLRRFIKKKRESETSEQRELRLQKGREYERQRVKKETPEERTRRLERMREFRRKRMAKETPDERGRRREVALINKRKRLANETSEKRAKRLETMRNRWREKVENETAEEKARRLARRQESYRRKGKFNALNDQPGAETKNTFWKEKYRINFLKKVKDAAHLTRCRRRLIKSNSFEDMRKVEAEGKV